MEDFIVGSSHMVNVTHINTPKSFYVRSVSLDKDVEKLERPGKPIEKYDISNKFVVYKSKILKKFVRGSIETKNTVYDNITCNILAIDYGFREICIPSKDIFMLKEELPFPPLAIHCELYMCEPIGNTFSPETLDAMKDFVGEHRAKITVMFRTEDKLTVELRTVECPDDVSVMLGLLHFTTLTKGNNSVHAASNNGKFAKVLEYKYKQVKIGDRFHVRVQSGDSITSFYVADLNDYKTYATQSCSFVSYCKYQPLEDNPSVAAAEGKCCGVKRQHESVEYERAIVKNIITQREDHATVHLIDWGKDIVVNFRHIKQVTSELYTMQPAIAIYCTSNVGQIWDNGLSKFLYPGYQFGIEIIEAGNGIDIPHKVKLFKVTHMF